MPSLAEKEDEENRVLAHYKKFLDQGPTYFGDNDEDDEELLQYEIESEKAGRLCLLACSNSY
jgi:pre-mRNA-splicing factor ISY1